MIWVTCFLFLIIRSAVHIRHPVMEGKEKGKP
jgi:hypothetical protein